LFNQVGSRLAPLRQRYSFAGIALALSLAIVVSIGIYAPAFRAPWDVFDYADFLPLLIASGTFSEAFQAVAAFYADHGRFQPLTHGLIALSWSLFGMNAAGWQLLRAILMIACTITGYVLLRRLGATRPAAAAGAALFVVAPSASASWILLAGEPVATLALLCAGILAAAYRQAARWRLACFSIAALCAAAVLAKETAVAVIPFIIALAWRGPSLGVLASTPSADRRAVWLVATVGAALALAAACILSVALSATGSEATYVASYGEARFGLWSFGRRMMWMALPFPPSAAATPGQLLLLPPTLIFGGIVLIGGAAAAGSPARLRSWTTAAVAAALLALAGALVYLPWPRFATFYGLPFLFGTSLVLAISLTMAARARPFVVVATYSGYLVLLTYMVLFAREHVVRAASTRTINAAVAAKIRQFGDRDSVLVANYYLPKQRWQALGATLGRYAFGGGDGPHVVDVPCERVSRMSVEPDPRVVLISYSNLCGSLPAATNAVRKRFRYVSWRTMAVVKDSIRVDILAPGRTNPARD
jgi:hypothetical protein